ncbi:hypothetical protein BT93_D0612 [Corymbia citriodora subsp. variegata]|nr:hypothetical protein BT93_D0612 [Corymbia citriodora subsp. variegata]
MVCQSELLLTVHCKSKNDDLGFHDIATGGTWEFSFRPNFFGRTLYFCSLSWPGQFRRFDIYVQSRDKCQNCLRNISPDYPCRLSFKTKEIVQCYPWNPPTQLGSKPPI